MRRRTKRSEEDFAAEICAHIALETDRLIDEGMSTDEADRTARGRFGNLTATEERFYESRRVMWLHDAGQDMRYAVRTLIRAPGFTIAAVLTLALGIGANTAIFSVVNSLLLKPLPYPDADRLVQLMAATRPADVPPGAPRRQQVGLTAAEVDQIRSRAHTLSAVGTVGPVFMGLSGYEDGAQLQGARVSAAALRMIAARPLQGRLFDSADERAGAEPVVLLSYAAWQRYFGGAEIVGRPLMFDSVLGPRRQTRYIVVGVMPPRFQFPQNQTQFWMPIPVAAADGMPVRAPLIAQLAEGVSAEAAITEVGPLVREIRRGRPGNETATYELVSEQNELVAPVRPALLVLAAAVGFVLLIACINVANLLLARTAARQREIATRVALGASRSRVVRLVVTESLVLAGLGCAVGLGIAIGGVELLKSLAATPTRIDLTYGGSGLAFPRLNDIVIDRWALGFIGATSLLTVLVFGLAPAFRCSWSATGLAMRGGTRSTGLGFGGIRLRAVLVVAEVGAALILLAGGGLLIRSFLNLSGVDAGFNPADVLTFQVSLPMERYRDDARLREFAEDLIGRLGPGAGTRGAAYARQLPMVQLQDNYQVRTTPAPPPPEDRSSGTDIRLVSRDYFSVMGIRVIAGHGFTNTDRTRQSRELLVNEALARRTFPNQSPVGRTLYFGRDTLPWEIVGVVNNVRQFGLDREPAPQVFADFLQWPDAGFSMFPVGAYYAVRLDGDPRAFVSTLRSIVNQLDPQAALFHVAPMEDVVAATISRPRMYAFLLGIFAAVSVCLAVIGLYGVMAYAVTQRTREIGIRMALGARRSDVLGLILGQSMILTAAGTVLGVLGTAATTRYLQGMLFGLTTFDAPTFLAVIALFAVVAAVASYLPARRATKVDPLIALHCEWPSRRACSPSESQSSRASDHGLAIPIRACDGSGHSARDAWSTERLDGPHPTARARAEGSYPTKGNRAGARVRTNGVSTSGTPRRFAPCRRHLLPGISAEGYRGPSSNVTPSRRICMWLTASASVRSTRTEGSPPACFKIDGVANTQSQ